VDHHLLVDGEQFLISHGPKENYFRPAIDPTFRSAARCRGPAVMGTILSGTLDDGTAGLLAIKRRGGLAIVQDPKSALFPGMPRTALEFVDVDQVLPPEGIGELLVRLAGSPVMPAAATPDPEVEVHEREETDMR